ncbi:MAG: hypothetical protein HC828_05880 [Blastochloris sp.]|nr:hypothetical protein [Blastochloris sp.]
MLDNTDSIARQADNADEIHVVDDVVRGVCSFSWNTPVATADGPVWISDIAVGDLVLAYHEGLRTTGSYTVTAVWAHDDPIILHVTLDGEVITTTPEHPFFVLLRGWVPAAELHIGDAVRRADGSYGRVDAVRVEVRTQRMYNFTVADAHTYFVGDDAWLVHNACWPPDLSGIKDKLEKIAKKFPPTSGNCHKCADAMADLIRGLGYDVDIAHFVSPSRTGWMGTLDNRTIGLNNWHEMVRIKGQGEELFIDAEVLLKNGSNPIKQKDLIQYYQDADLWSISFYR